MCPPRRRVRQPRRSNHSRPLQRQGVSVHQFSFLASRVGGSRLWNLEAAFARTGFKGRESPGANRGRVSRTIAAVAVGMSRSPSGWLLVSYGTVRNRKSGRPEGPFWTNEHQLMPARVGIHADEMPTMGWESCRQIYSRPTKTCAAAVTIQNGHVSASAIPRLPNSGIKRSATPLCLAPDAGRSARPHSRLLTRSA